MPSLPVAAIIRQGKDTKGKVMSHRKKGGSMKQKQVEKILGDRIDIKGMAKDFIAVGFTVPAKKKIVTSEEDFLTLLRSPNRMEKLSDEWFRDRFLSMIYGKNFDWAPDSLEKRIPWQEAEEYAAKFGRQAEDFELQTLIDRSRRNPAIVVGAEPLKLKTNDCYWSKTPLANSSGTAWCVVFSNGYVYSGSKGSSNYVRPVRSSQ